jgi:2,3-bisphosphoglycerate-independent phosphoglycerate mutase
MTRPRPVALVILDGWGLAPPAPDNAVALAHTPVFDRALSEYPHATLRTSGRDVGLPAGQMGNSEVGHLNLGAGFVVEQDLVRVTGAIEDGTFYDNPALVAACAHARARGSALHLAGLVGEGGVHAYSAHLTALLELAGRQGLKCVFVHAFTDGRDTAPDSGLGYLAALLATMRRLGVGVVATVSGRYYAMDRDRRWDRTARAWAALVEGVGETATDPQAAVRAAYAAGVTDEFIVPTVMVDGAGVPVGRVGPGDSLVCFNFRADRMRQLLAAFTEPDFAAFPRRLPADLAVTTCTEYVAGQQAAVAFPARDVAWPLARVLSEQGWRQLHLAETEKYAHVTYFFNGGREAAFPGEERVLVPSPQVATYDQAPAMSAEGVTDRLVAAILAQTYDFIVVNYANADMVGHSGDLAASVAAVEAVDRCLGRVLAALDAVGGAAVVTSDHGNAEMKRDPVSGGPHTAHTLNPVPFILVGAPYRLAGARAVRLQDGRLCDVAPTLLALMGLAAPPDMVGHVLVAGLPPPVS